MLGIVMVWLVIFFIIYIFSKKEDESSKDNFLGGLEEFPERRMELRKILHDTLSDSQKELELKRFGRRCYNCGTQKDLEFDHHIPLSLGYPLRDSEVGSNLVILCSSCNRRKGDMVPQEFYSVEKLKGLEDLGVRSHLHYREDRIKEVEELLYSERIKLLKGYIEDKDKIEFNYIDLDKILGVRERIIDKPVKIFSKRRYFKTSFKKDYYLKGSSGRVYNIKWIEKIGKAI